MFGGAALSPLGLSLQGQALSSASDKAAWRSPLGGRVTVGPETLRQPPLGVSVVSCAARGGRG